MGRKARKIPQRTCVACHKAQSKRDLIRVVRTPTGEVKVDPSGKQAGRGAYVCPTGSCISLALQRGALERALQTPLPEEIRVQMEEVRSAEAREN